MSEVETEKSPMSGWKATAVLAGTAIAGIWLAVNVLPVVAAHLILTGIVAGGAGAYVATNEGRREKAKSLFSKVTSFYKDAVTGFKSGWGKATKWAEEKEASARAKQAAEATGGTSPVATKEAANDFDNAASGAKVTVKSAPAPVNKPTARPGL